MAKHAPIGAWQPTAASSGVAFLQIAHDSERALLLIYRYYIFADQDRRMARRKLLLKQLRVFRAGNNAERRLRYKEGMCAFARARDKERDRQTEREREREREMWRFEVI